MTVFVVVVAMVCVAAAVAWFVLGRGHPETADSVGSAAPASTSEPTRSDRFHGGADRPAGLDAEPMDPEALGGDHRPPGS